MDRPTCVILVGPPGCGKSTYGKKYAEEHANTIVLSSDQIREELYGDASIQDDPARVFTLMQSRRNFACSSVSLKKLSNMS